MKKTFNFGKIDFNRSGRKINLVEVDVELIDDGVFTASGIIWNSKKTDRICAGQCLDTIAEYVKAPKFKQIHRLWKQYHLNDMHAGTEAQEEALNKAGLTNYANQYTECCNYLDSIGLLVDNGYKFGTGWLKRDIPEEDLVKIRQLLLDDLPTKSSGYEIQDIEAYNKILVKEI